MEIKTIKMLREDLNNQICICRKQLENYCNELEQLTGQCPHTDTEKKYYSCAGQRAEQVLCTICGKSLSWHNLDDEEEFNQ